MRKSLGTNGEKSVARDFKKGMDTFAPPTTILRQTMGSRSQYHEAVALGKAIESNLPRQHALEPSRPLDRKRIVRARVVRLAAYIGALFHRCDRALELG